MAKMPPKGRNKRARTEPNADSSTATLPHYPPDPNLYKLFKLNPWREEDRQKFDSEEIVTIVQQRPNAAKALYYTNIFGACHPLQLSIAFGASLHLVRTLYEIYPLAIKEKQYRGNTALHMAVIFGASFEVISFLVDTYPEALLEQSSDGYTPLHRACYLKDEGAFTTVKFLVEKCPAAVTKFSTYNELPIHIACEKNSPLQVIAFLWEMWQESVTQKGHCGRTPLHAACSGSTLDVISFLLEKYPTAADDDDAGGKDDFGNTPLHMVCSSRYCDQQLNGIMRLLLEKYPKAVKEKNVHGHTPLNCNPNYNILVHIDHLLSADKEEDSSRRTNMELEIMKDFIRMEWWGGVFIVLDHCNPSMINSLDIHFKIMPTLISLVGGVGGRQRQRCRKRLLSVWKIIRHRQDLSNGV